MLYLIYLSMECRYVCVIPYFLFASSARMVGLVGWPGGLRITPASYLSFFFFLGCCIAWVKYQLMWSRERLSLVVVFEVVSAVVCVASMH